MSKNLLLALNCLRKNNPYLREFTRKIYHSGVFQNNMAVQWIYRKTVKKAMERGLCFPTLISIEVTNKCNADCIMCPQGSLTRPKGIMSNSMFKKIIDEMADNGCKAVALTGLGEPLLDKDLEDKIRYAKQRDIISVQLFTNASLLNENRTEKIIKAGLDNIVISTDATDEETHEKIRRNLSFKTVERNIKNFIRIRNSLRVEKPKVKLNMTIFTENIHQRDNFHKKYKDYVDGIRFSYARKWGNSELKSLDNDPVSNRYMVKTHIHPCPFLWLHFNIFWDGSVPLCCVDFDRSYPLGQINTMSIKEIWYGNNLKNMRAQHLSGKFNENKLCRDCAYNISWFSALVAAKEKEFVV